jgi:pimeloyl-ACP methyl ester carboxylesterase
VARPSPNGHGRVAVPAGRPVGGSSTEGSDTRTVTLHGRPVTYIKAGSGPVLLLVHGLAGTIDNWRAVIEPLARHHTVIAPDLPGHGESARRR